MQISFKKIANPATQASDCLVLPVFKSRLGKAAAEVDKASGGSLRKLLKSGELKEAVGSTLLLHAPAGVKAERLLLLGCGERKGLEEAEFRKLLKGLLDVLAGGKAANALLFLSEIQVKDRDAAWQLSQLASAATLREYRYERTLSKPKDRIALKRLTVDLGTTRGHQRAAAEGRAIGAGMNVARELGDLPGNICTPTYLASQARSLARKHKSLSVKVLDEKQMRELGMGALLSVTAGSDQPAKLIVLEYKGGRKNQKPQALVGKGITFDSGGISIKPGAKMDEMKYDMCGAASVLGTLTTVCELKLPINVVGVIAASENLPSGRATKPGDVVTSMSGQTIEILNTDAEGRLVLCDALTYVGRFKPAAVIDIATLTGACVVALGSHATGLYANRDDFAEALLAAGTDSGDRAWHMPLWDDYQPQLDSNFADMANVGGPEAGSVTAACFLARFCKDYRWAHLDIAGTAWNSGGNKGATGRPVALLSRYLIDQSN